MDVGMDGKIKTDGWSEGWTDRQITDGQRKGRTYRWMDV